MAQRPGELRPRLRPPASVETSNRTGSMSEETSLSGSPEWIPRTRVHCMVKEETFGRMAHPTPYPGPPSIWAAWSRHWSHLKRDISDRSLSGGGCEAVQELVREIPAICGSYMVLPSLCEITTNDIIVCARLTPPLPTLPLVLTWSTKHLRTPAAHRLF